ncbi:MAG: alpha-keto acid decarboxylase family protein [Rhodopirellula sp.]|nr:alpha-keto acid decarboxylase family protein [Rhodopirellula sp.]
MNQPAGRKTGKAAQKSQTRKRAHTHETATGNLANAVESSRSSNEEIQPTIGEYLIRRLEESGVRHVFGVPGDFVLHFYGMLQDSSVEVIGTTNEAAAGYAADGYARINGLGAVCVTYCVGGLSLCNSVAGAFAEKSPVIVISGSPGISERQHNPLLHHKVRDFSTQRDVFEKLTVATAVLDDPNTAFREIDRCFEAALRYQRPVYLEIPRDCVDLRPAWPYQRKEILESSDAKALSESLTEAARIIESAKQPVIIAGVEIHRFGLQKQVIALAERNGIPICSTLLGKSVISEKHRLYLGVYEGAMGRRFVQEFVESSDCVILLGTFMTDINLGIFTANLDPARCIYCTSESLRIRHHFYHDVPLQKFVGGLKRRKLSMSASPVEIPVRDDGLPDVTPEEPLSVHYLFRRVNQILDENSVVIADVGDSLFGAADLCIHRQSEFLSSAYYATMGFAIPAALGAQAANPKRRPIVLVGDGAFQMTGMELSTILRRGGNPIVIVLNNHGYTTERFLQDGPFNDIASWNFHCLPALLGGGLGLEVRTCGELDQAVETAIANEKSFSLINAHLRPDDISPALSRLAERLSEQV